MKRKRKYVKRNGNGVVKVGSLNAGALQNILWDTLIQVKNNGIDTKVATAVSAQSREICRVAKLQLDFAKLANKKPRANATFFNA